MSDDWTLLRRLVAEQHWQHYPTFRSQFERAARELAGETGQERLARLTVSPRQFDRWIYGEISTLPRDGARQVLERLFDRRADELFSTEPILMSPAQPASSAEPATGESVGDEVEDLVLLAATESREHADRLAVHGVDPVAVARLESEIAVLAGEFATLAATAVLPRAQRLRRLACHLLDRTPRPEQARELYLIAGAACGLLSGASFDLGYRDAAAAHADAVWTYGSLINHDGLKAWARGMQALLANWSGRAFQAQQLAVDGLRHAPAGAARVRLHAIAARASAQLGDPAQTAGSVAAGGAALAERGEDELHDRIGGEFGFSAARQAWCISTAYVQLKDVPAAVHHAERALSLYRDLPAADRTPKAEAGAHVDLATAYLLQGELEGAEEALRWVLALPGEHRVDGVYQRLAKVRALLRATRLQDAATARRLLDSVEAFIAPVLPLSVGRPASGRPRGLEP